MKNEESPKKYSTVINPEIDDPYDKLLREKEKRKELLQKIEDNKHLIKLTKAMSGTPTSEGGMSREKANKTVQLLNKDISNLEKELRELESGSDNPQTNTEEIKPTPPNLPPKVEDKYRCEYVKTVSNRNPIIRDMPVISTKKALNWNTFASIILIVIILSLIFFVITHTDNSNSKNTNQPLDPSNNITDKVTNPALTLTNTSNTSGAAAQSKFKYTYIDRDGNLHEVTDYTSQGGSKYDVIIKNASASKNESVPTVNNVPELRKTEPSKSEDSDFITNLEKQIVEWWNENKPKVDYGVEASKTLEEAKIIKPEINIDRLENRIHELINQKRYQNGLPTLKYDLRLASIAQNHSKDMVNMNFFDHINPQGDNPTVRGLKSNYQCYKDYGSYYIDGIAENLFQNNLYDSVTYYNGIPSYDWNTLEEIAQSTVDGWMNSPGHRQNILTSTYDKEGIGVAISSDSKVLITENFC